MVKYDLSQLPLEKWGNQIRKNWREFWSDHLKPGLQDPRLDLFVERAGEILLKTSRRAVQVAGAKAIDEAVLRLGLGRSGVRLTAESMDTSTDRWEAELVTWTPAAIAEAADVVCACALGSLFETGAAEFARIESMSIRWLVAVPEQSVASQCWGIVGLDWPFEHREDFRRQVLSQIHQGASTALTAFGWSRDGRKLVEVDLVVEARARAQVSGR